MALPTIEYWITEKTPAASSRIAPHRTASRLAGTDLGQDSVKLHDTSCWHFFTMRDSRGQGSTAKSRCCQSMACRGPVSRRKRNSSMPWKTRSEALKRKEILELGPAGHLRCKKRSENDFLASTRDAKIPESRPTTQLSDLVSDFRTVVAHHAAHGPITVTCIGALLRHHQPLNQPINHPPNDHHHPTIFATSPAGLSISPRKPSCLASSRAQALRKHSGSNSPRQPYLAPSAGGTTATGARSTIHRFQRSTKATGRLSIPIKKQK